MKTIKVETATPLQLDWLVARALDLYVYIPEYAESPWLMVRSGEFDYRCPEFSTDWADGGPIMEQERLAPEPLLDSNCVLIKWRCRNWKGDGSDFYGPTMLIAAMRCFAASQSGEEVEVPDELGYIRDKPLGK